MASPVLMAVCVFVTMLSLSSTTLGQEADERVEFWPEVDVYVGINPKFRLFFLALITRLEQTSNRSEGHIGAHLDYLPNKHVILRNGYRYIFSAPGAESPHREHRIVIEQTFRHPLPLELLISDRSREELRFINGEFSGRYRNRLMLEREFEMGRFRITPYGSFEVFYDTRFDTWNRNQLKAGVQLPLKRAFRLIELIDPDRQVTLEMYFMRQLDSRSTPSHVKGVGLVFKLYL
jgi:Protein of unknown function (DUF2490)